MTKRAADTRGRLPLSHFLLKGGLGRRIDSYLDMRRRLRSLLLKMLLHGPCQWNAGGPPAPQNRDQTRMVP